MPDELLNDPRFPDRPTHPDFWRMSQVICGMDADASEQGRDAIFDLINDTADAKSLLYMAQQRALRFADNAGFPREAVSLLRWLYVEAFAAGTRFQREGGKA